MARVAAFLDPGRSLGEGTERAALAESLGYESVWASQTVARDPLQVLAHYASHTATIGLGTAVVPVMTRHPVQLAMEAATLDEASGGRLSLGIGISHRLTVETMWGMPFDHPVERMEEYATVLRQLFSAGAAGVEGRFYTARFGFSGFRPRAGIPILFAAMGPRMLRAAARLADGVVLWMTAPSVIRDHVRPVLRAALAEAGREESGFDFVAAVPVALTDDLAAGRDAFRHRALPYLHLPFYRKEVRRAGFGRVLEAVDREGPAAIPDEFVDAYAGVGDEGAVRRKVEEYRDAGATLPAVSPMGRRAGAARADATLRAAAP